jgi:hypothetical protein
MHKTFRFNIKDETDSIKHQNIFFLLGYSWANKGVTPRYTDIPYLYLRPNTMGMGFAKTLDRDKDKYNALDLESKLLHSKQKKFLQWVMVRKPMDEIKYILDRMFYTIDESSLLNDLIQKYKTEYMFSEGLPK